MPNAALLPDDVPASAPSNGLDPGRKRGMEQKSLRGREETSSLPLPFPNQRVEGKTAAVDVSGQIEAGNLHQYAV